ncbi:hypothetical protein PENARI_c011G00618 [Penicillium arizonense]|uniref:Uncharacterized protein n=1 Tax=Penicillium arizonense TaxID=1835702 RepID=A0A1F5LFN0_PENAI|nr:hypothetical protein PENARI_c011G00618 [Penicillium arizonense]
MANKKGQEMVQVDVQNHLSGPAETPL